MREPTIVYVNLRRPDLEVREALFAARRLGFRVALITDSPRSYVEPLVEATVVVDTYDVEATIDAGRGLARRLPVEGVVTWGDRDVVTVAHLAAELDLPGPSPSAAERARDKFLMKQALEPLEELLPRYAAVGAEEDLVGALARVGLPAILKPAGASGSKGIFEIRDESQAAPAYDALRRFAQPEVDSIFRQYGGRAVLEELIEGPEVVVEGWVLDGRAHVVGMTDTITTEPWHLEQRHVFPSQLPSAIQDEITQAARAIVETIGLDFCAFHIDGRYSTRGFRFFEVAARIGGDYETSHLIPMATGIDFYGQLLRIVTGREPIDQPARDVAVAGVRFLFADRGGRFAGLDGLDRTLAIPEVEHVVLETTLGADIALPPSHFTTPRVAAVLGRHATHEGLIDALELAAERCRPAVTDASAASGPAGNDQRVVAARVQNSRAEPGLP